MEKYRHPCERFEELEIEMDIRSLIEAENLEYLRHMASCPTGEHRFSSLETSSELMQIFRPLLEVPSVNELKEYI